MNCLDRLLARAGLIKICVIIVVAIYVALLLYKPGLSPSDEYAFLPTLQSGKFFPVYDKDFPYYDYSTLGRLGPLGGQEYNLAAPFTQDPIGYFVINAIELVVLVIALLSVLRAVSTNNGLNYLAVGFLLTVPAVTNTYFKLLFIDKNIATLLAMFLGIYITFQNRPRWGYFLAALVTANLAIYYKEPVFIAVGAFCAGHLFFTWRSASWRVRLLDLAGIASGLVWVLVYLILVLPHRTYAVPSGLGSESWSLVFAKTIFNYGFFTDPVLILIVLPLTATRLYQVFVQKQRPHPLADPMLGAASAYIGVFFVLNLYSPYYLLTAYVFALPAICHFLDRRMLSTRVWKVLFGVAGVAVVFNAVPTGLHYLTYNKYLPINFSHAMDVLIREVETRYDGKRVRIFFDGVDRGNGRGVYFIAGEFLKHRGLSIRKFDFVSDIETPNAGLFVGRRSPFDQDEDIRQVDPQNQLVNRDFPFTVFQPGPSPKIRSGDIFVVSPQSLKWVDKAYIDRLKQDYELVFESQSPLAVPNVTVKALAKYILMKRDARRGEDSGLMVSQNIFEWPDYYIFVKR